MRWPENCPRGTTGHIQYSCLLINGAMTVAAQHFADLKYLALLLSKLNALREWLGRTICHGSRLSNRKLLPQVGISFNFMQKILFKKAAKIVIFLEKIQDGSLTDQLSPHLIPPICWREGANPSETSRALGRRTGVVDQRDPRQQTFAFFWRIHESQRAEVPV